MSIENPSSVARNTLALAAVFALSGVANAANVDVGGAYGRNADSSTYAQSEESPTQPQPANEPSTRQPGIDDATLYLLMQEQQRAAGQPNDERVKSYDHARAAVRDQIR